MTLNVISSVFPLIKCHVRFTVVYCQTLPGQEETKVSLFLIHVSSEDTSKKSIYDIVKIGHVFPAKKTTF